MSKEKKKRNENKLNKIKQSIKFDINHELSLIYLFAFIFNGNHWTDKTELNAILYSWHEMLRLFIADGWTHPYNEINEENLVFVLLLLFSSLYIL